MDNDIGDASGSLVRGRMIIGLSGFGEYKYLKIT